MGDTYVPAGPARTPSERILHLHLRPILRDGRMPPSILSVRSHSQGASQQRLHSLPLKSGIDGETEHAVALGSVVGTGFTWALPI